MPLDLGALRSQSIADLVQAARSRSIENPSSLRKPELVAALLRASPPGTPIDGGGVLEILPDGFGFLRAPEYGYLAGPDDIYVSPSQIRRFNLRNGDLVTGQSRAPKENERYFALVKVERVNGVDAEAARDKVLFENLAPQWPTRRLALAREGSALARLMDLYTPVGLGQRALVVGPPRSGRSTVLATLARAVVATRPDAALFTVLIAERPEEAAELAQALPGDVVTTTFDEPETRHVQVVDMVIERAKRLVENGRDAVVLVDSLTRLARAAHASAPASGRTLPGGLDASAVQRVRRLLGAARAVAEGGSLTVVGVLDAATCGQADAALLAELRGAANLELHLTEPGDVAPTIDVAGSGTLREDLMLAPSALTALKQTRAKAAGSLATALVLLDK
jgi:transcription termination factor Rho